MKKAREKCKGTGKYITRDFPKAISEARKQLGHELVEARKHQKTAYIAFPAKLVVNGEVVSDKFPGWDEFARKSYSFLT
jgi:hypothetical protein